MKKLIDLMTKFGASFLPKKKYTFPLKLISSKMPIGINYEAGVSAQLKSAVILAGLNSYGVTSIKEVHKSRDHTENILMDNKEIMKIMETIYDFEAKIIDLLDSTYIDFFMIDRYKEQNNVRNWPTRLC